MKRHRIPTLSTALQTMIRLYPWSVLWILFATALAIVVSGNALAIAIVFALILIVIAHSAHREHRAHKEAPHD